MAKEETQKKDGTKESAKDTSKEKPKSIRRQVCCCLGILGVLILFAILVLVRFVCGSDKTSKIPVFNTNTQTQPSTTQTKTYPAPQDCEPLNALAVIPLAISADNPGMHQKTENHYYQIYAYVKSDVYNQINACGPNIDGQAYFGIAKSQINWTYDYTYSGDSCNVRDVAVGVHTDIYYPNLEVLTGGDSSLAGKWDNYMPKLVFHEEGHRDNAVNAGNQILNAISSLPTMSCATMSDQVNVVVNNIIESYHVADANYDDTTNHGETQGADF